MRHAVVLLNPAARRAGDQERRSAFVRVLARTHRVDLVVPSTAADVTRCARDAAAAGADVVIAAGGDGTMNAVARGLVHTTTPLAFFPLGTANDLARELGVPGDPAAAAALAGDGSDRSVDVIRVTMDAFAEAPLFVGVGGLALVSRTALAVTRARHSTSLVRGLAAGAGSAVYRLSATASLLLDRRLDEAVRVDIAGAAAPIAQRYAAIFVTNHRATGGGLRIPSGAVPDDGACEICLVPARSRATLALNFARLSSGVPLPAGVLVPHRATAATIVTEHDDVFVADGEPLASGRRFLLRVEPRALRVRRSHRGDGDARTL